MLRGVTRNDARVRDLLVARRVQRLEVSHHRADCGWLSAEPQEVPMPDDRRNRNADPTLDPEDVNSAPQVEPLERDPNDEIPVPIAMSPAEVDERAQVVETLREEELEVEREEPRSEERSGG